MNIWLKAASARKIADELQRKYHGQPMEVEDEIIESLWNHPLYADDMWLELHADDFGDVCWLQIGTGELLVPR